jgi:hypothetical protein
MIELRRLEDGALDDTASRAEKPINPGRVRLADCVK